MLYPNNSWDPEPSTGFDPVGRTLHSIKVSPDNCTVVRDLGEVTVTLGCEGDCCASAYFTDLEIASDLPAVITEWDDDRKGDISDTPGYVPPADDGWPDSVHDVQFVKVKTERGYVDFNLHTEHNGYYGGWYFLESVKANGE